MWNALIRWSIAHRVAVLGAACLLAALGCWRATRMAVDVLPEITAPTVTVITEAHGMAPDEVETLVTVPIETALNGTPGLRRLRSSSGIGIAIVWAEFDWDIDAATARQAVAERLQVVRGQLPDGLAPPVLAPMSSVMGEIMFLGLVGGDEVDAMALRDVAQWELRRRLLAVPGVAQVTPIGGDLRQVHVVLRPHAMEAFGIGADTIVEALAEASTNAPGGFLVSGHQEYLIRGIGRAETLEDLGGIFVARRAGQAILLSDVADVGMGAALTRGLAAIDGRPGVVLAIQKQPGASTLDLTRQIDVVLDSVEPALPAGVELKRHGFRQASFIRSALSNVLRHIAESAVLVVVLLILFLGNWRSTLISVTALPLSLLTGIVVLDLLGAAINTMTLGGFAIAIGALVDDAIIDVENVHRRLGQRARQPEGERLPFLETVFRASSEIRSSIVVATAVIVVVFLPLFFLGGLEGRLLVPLGLAYVVSLLASLLVAVTVTPALCAMLLRDVGSHGELQESRLVRMLKRAYEPALSAALAHRRAIAVLSLAGTIAAVAMLLSFGRAFLPGFNEGSFTIAAATVAGAPLEESDRAVSRLESALLGMDFVTSIMRRTGRAEEDEHAQDVQFSEMEVTVDPELVTRDEAAARIRAAAATVPGLAVSVGQPIGHRIEHMISGVKTSIAVKVFGDDLGTLRGLARRVEAAMSGVEGIVDLSVETQTDVPQVTVRPRPALLAEAGMRPGELAEMVELAFLGHEVGQWWHDGRALDVVVRHPESARASLDALRSTQLGTREGGVVALGEVARVDATLGPNLINRENVRRRIVVMANVADRDIRSVIGDVRAAIADRVEFPQGYYLEYGGEFESEARASRTILLLSGVALIAMILLLWTGLSSLRDAMLVLVNLPLGLVGGVIAVALTGGVLDIASMVGFITLFGIAARNGILLVTHYRHLRESEGASVDEAIRRGSMERLSPILMTALGAGLALVPIAMAAGEPGNEIQAPMALVILAGLVSSTFLNMIVVPALSSLVARSVPSAD